MTKDQTTPVAVMTVEQVAATSSTQTAASSSISSLSRASERKAEKNLGKLGRFEIKQVLGQGAFGRVFRAYDPVLDRYVALKVPTFGSNEEQKVRRFLGEAKAAAGLRHPNIVPVYECGEADGKQFIAAQFVAGQTLGARMKAGPISFQVAVGWVRAIADALAYAHAEGIVHRDIKPDNVMLDAKESPQIMDFGLAKRTSDDSSMTMDGTILGTPAYMSPEQATGRQALIGPASDQYSLGAMLYELLTGKKPFEGAPHAVIAQVISQEPALPRSINPHIPPDLEAICLKAMQKETSARYASAADLATDLGRWLRGEAVKARAATPVERLVRWCKRNPQVAGLACALLVALGLGTIVSSLFAVQASRRATLARQQAERADREAQRADAEAQTAKAASAQAQRDSEAAKNAEARASRALRATRQREYFSSMLLAQSEWDKSNLARLTQLLKNQVPAEGEEDHRHFEWYYWWNQAHKGLTFGPTIFLPNIGSVPVMSQDGELIAYGDRNQFTTYERLTGKVRTFPFSEKTSNAGFSPVVALSSDRRLLAGSLRGEVEKRETDSPSFNMASVAGVQIWDLESGKEVARLPVQAFRVSSLAFSPDGSQLAVATDERANPPKFKMQLWRLDGTQVWQRDEQSLVASMTFDASGAQLLLARSDGVVWLDPKDGRQIRKMSPPGMRMGHIAYHAATQQIACGADDGTVVVFHAVSGNELARLKGHSGWVQCLAFSPEGSQLVSAAYDNSVRIWDLKTRSQIDMKPLRMVRALGTANGVVRALSWGRGYSLVEIDLSSQVARPRVPGMFHGFSQDGSRALIADRVVDLQGGKELFVAKGYLTQGVLNFKGTQLAIASWEVPGAVDLFNVDSGERVARLEKANQKLRPMAFYRGDSRLITIDNAAGESDAWSTATGKHEEALSIPKMLAVSDDERWIAYGQDRDIVIREVATGVDVARATRDYNFLYALSPRWDAVAVTKQDGEVVIYDIPSGQERAVLQGHADRVESLAFTSDGKRLVTGSYDKTARVWDTETGYELLSLPTGTSNSTVKVAFRRDDRLLAVWAASSHGLTTFYEAFPPPRASFAAPESLRTGMSFVLDATKSRSGGDLPLRYQWTINDAPLSTAESFSHQFPLSGEYRVGLRVSAGQLSDWLTRVVRVLPNTAEIGTEQDVGEWSWVEAGPLRVDFQTSETGGLVGRSFLTARCEPYHGALAELLYPKSQKLGLSLDGKSRLLIWMKAATESNIGWQFANPVVTLHEAAGKSLKLTPRTNRLPNSRNLEEAPWAAFVVPLSGDEQWQREGEIETLNWLTLGVDSWDHPTLRIWLDGIFLE